MKYWEQLKNYLPVFSDQEYSEEIRLKYRFLDLRRAKIHKNINLRSKVISYIRKEMENLGFLEYQTPILTSSSPEGARDFLYLVDLTLENFMLFHKPLNNLSN